MNPRLILSSTLVHPNDFTRITIQTYETEEVHTLLSLCTELCVQQ